MLRDTDRLNFRNTWKSDECWFQSFKHSEKVFPEAIPLHQEVKYYDTNTSTECSSNSEKNEQEWK